MAGELVGRLGQQHPVLRALGPGERWYHGAHIQLQRVGEHRVRRALIAPHALSLGVGFNQRNRLGLAAGEGEVAAGLRVDREETTGRAVLGGHVGDGGAVGEAQVRQARAVELDKLTDNTLFAQHLHDHQHQVGGRGAFDHFAVELEADHLRHAHRYRLAEHGRFGFDPADTPAQHREAVDHGGVRVRADQRVGVGDGAAVDLGGPDGLGEVFEVDLVTDAGPGWHHAEVFEGRLAPAQELVALLVALELDFGVLVGGIRVAEVIDHHRVVDDQIDGGNRVDLLGVSAQLDHRFAHGGEVYDRRHAGKVLQQHPRRAVGDFRRPALIVQPLGKGLDIVGGHGFTVFEPEQVFQQDLQRERQP